MAKKKKTPKKAVKKTAKKKTPKKKAKKGKLRPVGLHNKKLAIMAAVPIMPCSMVSKDKYGALFAHTRAVKVFATYYQECLKYGLTIRLVELEMSDVDLVEFRMVDEKWVEYKKSYSRANCKFIITDSASGEHEMFCGSGLGENSVWSDTSAQTVAMKQALLLYFATAWPEPTSILDVVKDQLKNLNKEETVNAIKTILPPTMQSSGEVIQALEDFWADQFK